LHFACEHAWLYESVIPVLIEHWPMALRIKTSDGILPIHLALKAGKELSLKTIKDLVDGWPHAVHAQDNSGRLPLHYACEYGCSDDVIQFLVECWPMALRIKKAGGSLLLHLAVSKYQVRSLKAIQMLVEAWPDAVREHDNYGRLPLHRACEHGCKDEVIQFLVRSWPESCQVPTKEGGQLPLHLACSSYEASAASIRILLDCYPQAIRYKDNNLQLPLHIACMQQPALPLEVVEHLVRAWPESVQIACPYTSYYATYW